MTIVDPSDPTRYTSGYALVVLTQAERGLQRELANHADSNVLEPDARDKIVYQLRAARTAALRAAGGELDG